MVEPIAGRWAARSSKKGLECQIDKSGWVKTVESAIDGLEGQPTGPHALGQGR